MPLHTQCRMTVRNFVKIVWTVFEQFEIFMKRSGGKKQHDCISGRNFFPTPKKVPEYDSPVNVPNFEKTMVLAYCDKNEVAQIINALKNKKSVGHDGLSNEMLKHCSPVIEKYLSEAFNMSISNRKFPEFLKLAKVVPIFKKGDKTSPENYRPISLCSISKIFEKLLYNRMVQFFVNRKLFASEQFGFRKKRLCVHAISTVTDYIREKIDKKSTGQACFIDLQKAFDTLDHSILLKNLYAYGYRGPIFEILMDYLANRYQYIETSITLIHMAASSTKYKKSS